VELRVLGPFELVGDDGRVLDVGGVRPQALLVALALAGGHPVAADQLLDQVWPGEEFPDRNRLQVQISRLRRALGADRISSRGGGYALELPASALDATRFDHLVAEGRAALQRPDPVAAASLLRRALGLWRGVPLPEFADTGFAPAVIIRLEETRLAATEDRVEADLLLGGHGELAGELEALVRAHPLRERLWGQLMVALYRSGRQGDALGAYQRARAVLADELGVDPGPELRQLETAVLSQDPALEAPATGHAAPDGPGAGNLPAAPSALVGRSAELDALASLLQASRAVTVVGPGGVGKTRLAIEAARSRRGGYRDGVWLVELAPVGESAGVPSAVAATLGVSPAAGPGDTGMLERLGEFLSRREALLVLDNCEHVVAGAAQAVHYLLARCPGLQILATSREGLAVAGESQWPLPPLAMDEAAELFLERARAIAPAFQADEPAMSDVREICARLDGMPLAIELAAARMRALAPSDVLARLGDRFRLLTTGSRTAPPRHQTLRAVIDWSYDLLFDEERRVFERMAVFAGECTLPAAEQVCAGDTISRDDVADLLARLVDRSLVMAIQTRPGVRFRILQTLAEYGREKLAARGDLPAVRARHARWVASFVDVPDGGQGPAWFAEMGKSLEDIRRAMESALASGDADTSLALACGLGWFWGGGGVIDDCWRWLTASLSLAQHPTARSVRALALAEHLSLAQGRDHTLAYGEKAVDLGRTVGDPSALAFAAVIHGSALTGFFGQRERAVQLLEEAGALLQSDGGAWSAATGLLSCGVAALARTDLDQAWALLRRAADDFATMGNARARAAALRQLADLSVMCGRYEDAGAALREALSGLGPDDVAGITSMAQLGCLHEVLGRSAEADRWHARARAAAENQQHVPLLAFASNAEGLTLRRRGRLGEAEHCHRRALGLCRERGVLTGLALAHASLGYLAELRHDGLAAEQHHRASLEAACGAADLQAQALALEGLAGAASLLGDARATGRLLGAAAALREGTLGPVLGAATALRETITGRLSAAERIDTDRAVARFGDHETLDAAFAEGLRDPQAVLSVTRAGNSDPASDQRS
jgi:predicted ATPase/DNA-binding SARP family transcriptional activator